jgi:hypothetical protein
MAGGRSGTIGNREGKRQGNRGEFDWESYCLNWLVQAAGERKGRRRESWLRRRAGEAEEKKKKGRGREETDRWDPVVSESKKKKKREMAWTGAGRGW